MKRALEEKKSVREEAKNFERSAMQSFKEKTDVDEVYTKVIYYAIQSSIFLSFVDAILLFYFFDLQTSLENAMKACIPEMSQSFNSLRF